MYGLLKNRRIEVVALAVIGVAIATVVGLWASGAFAEEVIFETPPLNAREGEWIVANNEAALERQRECGVSEKFMDPGVFGAYSGSLELRFDSVKLWDSPMDAGVRPEEIQLASYLDEWDELNYCEVVYTIKNVSAEPYSDAVKSGHRGFNVSFFLSLEGAEDTDQIYFDGMIEDGSLEEGDGNVFYLAPGEQRTFTSGIAIIEDGIPNQISVGIPGCGGYLVDVVCEDRRGVTR